MSQFTINNHRTALGDVRHRKNLLNCSDAEIEEIRRAYTAVYSITNRDDNRGYQYWAGKHGRPEAACDHGRLFLPWHRAYLYGLEKAMQYHREDVTLPYWNWTGSSTLAANALPAVCSGPTLPNGDSNPLHAGPIYFQEANGNLVNRQTARGDRNTPTFTELKAAVDIAFGQNEFLPFQGEINGPHGGLHVRVGGDMGSLDYAAYDPIFWMHHANVDRQWALWQRSHDGTVVPRLDYSLPDVDMTVGKTVDHRKTLGYDYVANECFERFSRDNVDAGMVAFNDSPTQYSVADLADGFDSAVLEFHNVGHPLEGTREIRVFINQPGANADSDTEGNPHYAGSRILLGKTMCYGEAGHCEIPMDRQKFDVRTRPPMKPLKVYMDVTRTLRIPAIVATVPDRTMVTLVVVDQDGNPLPLNAVRMDGLSFITRDGIGKPRERSADGVPRRTDDVRSPAVNRHGQVSESESR